MQRGLIESWRRKVFLLLWHDVWALCPGCLRERSCQLRVARLSVGGELRDLSCGQCKANVLDIAERSTMYLDSDALASERDLLGSAPHKEDMAEKFVTPEMLHERDERDRVRAFNDQRIRFALAGLEAEDTRSGASGVDGRRVAPIYRLHDPKNAKFHPTVVRAGNQSRNLFARLWVSIRRYFGRRDASRQMWSGPRGGDL